VHQVEDWAEVRRLHEREGLSQAAIARRLGMSRNTVARLLTLAEPPRYRRPPKGSLLDPFVARIAAMLDADPSVRAPLILERLRAEGFAGGITILKDHLAAVRPAFLAARSFQRTAYRPGEIGQVDWWHTGAQIPVGHGRTREAFGLVASLPHSGAHAAVFSFTRTLADVRPALLGCLERLGGVPEALVFDNDASIVASREGGRARLHPELAALLGALTTRAVVLRPRRPTSKGQVERTIGYLETSFLPLRTFGDLDDLQGQHDTWASEIAVRRTLRRTGRRVEDAWAVERGFLRRLPQPLPEVDWRFETRASADGYVRVDTADYSVPPAFVGRRVTVRAAPRSVHIACEGTEIATHRRSYLPADIRRRCQRSAPARPLASGPAPHTPELNRRPMRKPIAAAPRPMATNFRPLLRQSPTSVSAEYVPTPNRARALSTIATTSAGVRARTRNGSSGIRWPMNVAIPTTTAVRRTSRDCTGCRWSSSSIIVASQVSRFAVMVSTTSSSNVPLKPFAA
jgi:transposase